VVEVKNVWWLGARPKTLGAAIAPVSVGTAIAFHSESFNLLNAALAAVVGLAMQIAVNYANDYSDGIKGSDSVRVGPVRIVATGLASAAAVKRAAMISFAIAAIAGLALAYRVNWWLILIGAIAILAAWFYTGGKSPYGSRGFGEIFWISCNCRNLLRASSCYFADFSYCWKQHWLALNGAVNC
jgi:1,4-dihydroxy-2-naphthoate polyprenyltransferase